MCCPCLTIHKLIKHQPPAFPESEHDSTLAVPGRVHVISLLVLNVTPYCILPLYSVFAASMYLNPLKHLNSLQMNHNLYHRLGREAPLVERSHPYRNTCVLSVTASYYSISHQRHSRVPRSFPVYHRQKSLKKHEHHRATNCQL